MGTLSVSIGFLATLLLARYSGPLTLMGAPFFLGAQCNDQTIRTAYPRKARSISGGRHGRFRTLEQADPTVEK